uniref:Riboflavin transporter n=1 Tax=Geotrypetes seraphini TaxID=260995 RepID=A0A6P8QG84_GEOSA|nr:riboflavin transporter 2-like isoform X2 [Geotrypetes seraphini]
MALEVHLLACLLGVGSWVAINGVWVELPLIVPDVPEGWHLPSYFTVLIQFANLGPFLVMLMHQFQPGRLNETAVIYTIVSIGVLSCLLLAFFWRETTIVGGAPHSTALLVLIFFLSIVDCTSSVTFLPFMMQLKAHYLTTYFIGEGLSGLIPGFVALAQGVGVVHCINGSLPHTLVLDTNITKSFHMQAVYQPARFPVKVFFLFLTGMMIVCLTAFVLLNHLPSAQRERDKMRVQPGIQKELSKRKTAEKKPMISDQEQMQSSFGTGTFSWSQVIYIFLLLAWANALTNGVLPAVQSYSCLPYGNSAYHLSVTLAALANPLACLITMILPNRSLMTLGILTTAGTGIGSYIMTMAVLSPCPLLLHTHIGIILIKEW